MVQKKAENSLESNMSNKVKNNLKNVKIGGNYTGGDGDNSTSPSKQNWLVPIIVALITAVGAVLVAVIKTT